MMQLIPAPSPDALRDFHGILSCAPQMTKLFEQIERVAPTDASVLLRGETGTGKELIARALHAMSGRHKGPFRAVNCATLTSELLASELFGHVKGAFTGAVAPRQGLFALADHGTVFLDEVAEIAVDVQARLLRVLQEQAFVPLGGTTPVKVDVRVISATHQSLREAVEAKRFRADLMYRIRVVPLFIPPLRDREGDIEALAWRFIRAHNAKGRRQITHMEAATRDAMLGYDWPGNVRELRNVIEYAFAIGQGPHLSLEDLTPELRGQKPPLNYSHQRDDAPPINAHALERALIMDALRASSGRRAEAAAALGMSRSTLWRKMREHGL